MKSRKPAPEQPRASEILDAACRSSLSKLKPVKEARRRLPGEPDLVPLFPITYLTLKSNCPHGSPIRRGTKLVCMICHRSGLDHLSVLRRSPATDPKPEKKPAPSPAKKLTRREIRALQREWSLREGSLTPEERGYLREHGVVLGKS